LVLSTTTLAHSLPMTKVCKLTLSNITSSRTITGWVSRLVSLQLIAASRLCVQHTQTHFRKRSDHAKNSARLSSTLCMHPACLLAKNLSQFAKTTACFAAAGYMDPSSWHLLSCYCTHVRHLALTSTLLATFPFSCSHQCSLYPGTSLATLLLTWRLSH